MTSMIAAERRGYRWSMLLFMIVAVNFKARAQNNCPTPDSGEVPIFDTLGHDACMFSE